MLKFRGAGQGPKVLVAEVVVGELARALGIRVPDLRAVDLDARIARYEADEEVQDLLTASVGLNLGVDFLPGSFGYDGARPPTPEEAARILWLDAFTANVDRTWSNPNLLVWHGRTWAIDHGAALYFQHSLAACGLDPGAVRARSRSTPRPTCCGESPATSPAPTPRLTRLVTPDLLGDVLSLVPDEWLEPAPGMDHPAAVRAAYVENLLARLAGPRAWLPAPARRPAGERAPGRLPVRRAAVRPARGPRRVPQRRGGPLQPAGRLPRRRVLPRPRPAVRPRARARPRGRRGLVAHARRRLRRPVRARAPGDPRPGPRFGWISAPRSTVLQPGPVHGGLTADPAATLATLVHRLVG